MSAVVSVDLRGTFVDELGSDAASEERQRPLRRFEWIVAERRWGIRDETSFEAPLPEKDALFADVLDEALSVEPLRKREEERE